MIVDARAEDNLGLPVVEQGDAARPAQEARPAPAALSPGCDRAAPFSATRRTGKLL
jgi:hypothetical protein